MTVIGLRVAVPPGATGLGDWTGMMTPKPVMMLSVADVVAVVTVPEPQELEVYSVAVTVKDPPVDPAVTEVPVKLAVAPDTRMQLLVGALKVAPPGSPVALNFTKSPLVPPATVMGL